MIRQRFLSKTLLLVLCLSVVGGCSSGPTVRGKADYKKAITLPPLDVPPDLTAPAGGDDTDFLPKTAANGQGSVLPQFPNVHVERDGDRRWLVIQAPPEKVWPLVRRFWLNEGLPLRVEEPKLGIMETQWAENRADIPESFLRGLISRLFPSAYSAATRDKFRVRLERGEQPGTTDLYLTHYGVEEVTKGDDQTVWQSRPSDPELVDEMLNRLLVFLGVPEELARSSLAAGGGQATTDVRRETDPDGRPLLVLDQGFPRAWRRVGIALDRLGLVVEDRDRSKGVYFIRAAVQDDKDGGEKKGWLSRLFSGGKKAEEVQRRYRIVITPGAGEGDTTRIALEDAKGAPLPAGISTKLLERLAGQLR